MSSVSQFPPPHLIADNEQSQQKDQSGDADHTTGKSLGDGQEGLHGAPLSLPAPGDSAENVQAREDDDGAVKFDRLGPMVVNTDGTISKIHNWSTMTDDERARTMRLVNKRNQARLAQLREAEGKVQEDAP